MSDPTKDFSQPDADLDPHAADPEQTATAEPPAGETDDEADRSERHD